MLRKILEILPIRSGFSKNVAKVFSGSAIATVIAVVTLPIITRLFSPEEYGLYQLLISLITILSAISSLKYEMAIVLPNKGSESRNLTQLSLLVLLLTTLLFSLMLYLGGAWIFRLLNAEQLTHYVLYIAVGIFLGGLIEVFRYILVSKKEFGKIAAYRISQATVTQTGAIGIGYYSPTFLGLFISYISGHLTYILLYLIRNRLPLAAMQWKDLKGVASKHRKFPTINTISVFLNKLSLQLPVFMFSAFFTPEIIGLYNLAHKCINLPVNFLGNAVSQVYYKEAADAYQKSPEALMRMFVTIVKKITVIGIVPLVLVLFFAPFFTKLIFDPQWSDAGRYMQIIIFWVYFQFINASIGTTYSILNKQEFGMYLIAIFLLVRYFSMVWFSQSPEAMLIALTVATSLFYITYSLTIYYLIRRKLRATD